MESDLQPHPSMFHEQQQMNSGLTRYRSAPSSFFTNVIDSEFYEHVFNRPSSPETERVFSRLISSFGDDSPTQNQNLSSLVPNPPVVKQEVIQNQQPQPQPQPQVMPSVNNEPVLLQQQQQQQQQPNNMNMYESAASRNIYQSSAKPPLPQTPTSANRLPPMKTGIGSSSNLIRHSSSPAGLFANINIDPGYIAAMRGMGTFGAGNTASEEANFPAAAMKNPPAYSSGLMSSIAGIGDKNNREMDNPQDEGFGEGQGNDFMTGFPVDQWDDSAIMSDDITGLKRYRDDDTKPFSGIAAAETKNESGSQPPAPLAHHLSLPKTAAEMAAIEKLLQYSDSVPCKIRAKRGCATHPRSIAERVRRTKISERMRRLQDLVPNMDKQTNTSDMLDLAVDYIKDLQKQVQTLSDSQAKCTCSRRQHH